MGYSFGVMLEPLMTEFKVGAGSVSFVGNFVGLNTTISTLSSCPGSILNGVIMLSAPFAAVFINK